MLNQAHWSDLPIMRKGMYKKILILTITQMYFFTLCESL
jgi:hypothetical protein